jgi:hypothetical protein
MTINFKVERALAELKKTLKEDCNFSELQNAAQSLANALEAEQEEELQKIRLRKEKEKNDLCAFKSFFQAYEAVVEKEKLEKKLIVDDLFKKFFAKII